MCIYVKEDYNSILCEDINNHFEDAKYLVERGARIDDRSIQNASHNQSFVSYLRKHRSRR